MLNWILSSSVLILGIIGVRFLFRKQMKSKIQYALWLLVLLRLLIPFNIGHSGMSVSNFSGAVHMPQTMPQQESQIPQPHVELPDLKPAEIPEHPAETPAIAPEPSRSFRDILPMVLTAVWLAGSVTVGLVFLRTNLTFRRRLTVSGHRLPVQSCRLPVYVTNRIKSPCLFGILHPGIYVHGRWRRMRPCSVILWPMN